jgi:hypothetical protein
MATVRKLSTAFHLMSISSEILVLGMQLLLGNRSYACLHIMCEKVFVIKFKHGDHQKIKSSVRHKNKIIIISVWLQICNI